MWTLSYLTLSFYVRVQCSHARLMVLILTLPFSRNLIIVRIITNISLIDIYFSILVICLLDLILILKGEILS